MDEYFKVKDDRSWVSLYFLGSRKDEKTSSPSNI
jgi:hypothetical protein